MERWQEAASILEDGEEYHDAVNILQAVVNDSVSKFLEHDLRTLAAEHRLAKLYARMGAWDGAKQLWRQQVRLRALVQGASHPDT